VILPVGVMLIGVLLIALGGGTSMLPVRRVLSGLGAGAAVGVTTLESGLWRSPTFVNQLISYARSFRLTFLAAVPLLFSALIARAVSGIVSVVRRGQAPRPAEPIWHAVSVARTSPLNQDCGRDKTGRHSA
jgi:hypothetical protein